MPIWAFRKSKKKSKIYEPTAQHRGANSSGQNSVVHLYLRDKGLSFEDDSVPIFAREEKKWFTRKVKEAIFPFFRLRTGEETYQSCNTNNAVPPEALKTARNVRTPFHDANDHYEFWGKKKKKESSTVFKCPFLMFSTRKVHLGFHKNSKDKRLKKLHTSLWQWWLKNSNLKFSEVSSVFRQWCSKTGMQQILWLPRTFHYTSAKRPSLLKLQAFQLSGVLWSF